MNASAARCHRGGFTLVEVALACGIAAFCLITVFSLLPIGARSNRASVEQTAANSIFSAVAADLRATPPTVPTGGAATSPQFKIPIPANPVQASAAAPLSFFLDNEGRASGTSGAHYAISDPKVRYRLTVTFLANGSHARAATLVSLQTSWPATPPTANAEGSAMTFLALDRN